MIIRRSIATSLFLAISVLPSAALDQPIGGAKLALKEGRLLFLSKDPAFLFPAVGGSDDPSTAGAEIEFFSKSGNSFSILIPPGVGKPGWKEPASDSHSYLNKEAPAGPSQARSLSMRQSKRLKAVTRQVGPFVNGPLGSVGIRITTGSVRSCALFEDAAIRKDVPGSFVARNALATALTDCSDDALINRPCAEESAPTCAGSCPAGQYCFPNGSTCACETLTCGSAAAPTCDGTCPNGETCLSEDGSTCACAVACSDTTFPPCDGACAAGSTCATQDINTCICISAAQPCGDTTPVCNGECDPGDECMPIGGWPLATCGCLPIGSNSCQHAVCGGDCPAGDECNFFEIGFPGASGCSCGPPGPCGSGGDECPPGQHCGFFEGSGFVCVPN